MNINRAGITFNEEERYISGLPDRLSIEAIGVAFGIARRARAQCYNSFLELLLCDIEDLSDDKAATLQAYPDRLRRLDDLSERLVPVLMPQMISELERGLPELR